MFLCYTFFPSLPGSCPSRPLFAHNVSEDSGFVNTKKYWNEDSNLCWAATASNMLQWWQNNSSGIPPSVPNGQNESRRTKIYDVFYNKWANIGKGVEIGLRWYLGGKSLNTKNYLYDFKDTVTDPKNTGHYWEEYIASLGSPPPRGKATRPFISSKYFMQDDFPSSSVQTSFHFSRTVAWWAFLLLPHQARATPLPARVLKSTTLPE